MSTREIDDLLLHIRGLVLVREILKQRDASEAELQAHTEELERLKDQLAQVAVPATGLTAEGIHDGGGSLPPPSALQRL
jgi:phage-related minor tail protein